MAEAGVQYYPALKLKMGSWTYYSITMTMAEVARKIQFSSEVSDSKILNEHLQRGYWARKAVADDELSCTE